MRANLATRDTELANERTKSTKLETDLTAERGNVTKAQTDLAAERTAHDATKTKLTTAETNFANERKVRVEGLISDGIKAGRVGHDRKCCEWSPASSPVTQI